MSDPFRVMSDAVLAIASQLAVEPILRTIVDSARELVGAHYAALGVPDGEGSFDKFITSGITDAQWDAIGPLPKTHGILGLLFEDPAPVRLDDLQQHPRFGGWPDAHPNMRSFLGVPIVAAGEIVGAIFLNNKIGGGPFTDSDEELVRLLAAHAAIALTNARLYERARELTVVEERNRLARELHDAVAQTLFSVRLTAEAAAALAGRDPARAEAEMRTVAQLARRAISELRAVVFELRPADLAGDGLVETLRKHCEVLTRAYGVEVAVTTTGPVADLPEDIETAVFRVAQEAIHNALKHARTDRVEVRLGFGDPVVLEVCDRGAGFDPAGRDAVRRLGLTSMRERAEAVGGTLAVDTAPGRGTAVRLEVPRG